MRVKAATLIIVGLLAGGVLLGQQEPVKPHEQSSQAAAEQHQNAAPSEEHATPRGQLAKASNEAAGVEEDENAQFKQSASVHLIARVTGLSLHAAYWVSIVFNFVILALLIVLISKSKLPAMFRTRTGDIQRGITEARKASEDANRRLADVESRLARLDADVAEMRNLAENEAAVEEQRMIQAVEDEKRKIVEAANSEIAAASKIAQRDLKAFAAELAVSLAQKQIRVDLDTDRALVSNFVEELNGTGSSGKGGR